MTSDTLIHNTWVGKAHFFYGLGLITHKTSMVDEWEAQNILTSYILWTVNTTTLIHQTWVGNTHFLHDLGLITHKTSMVDEWEAQNKLFSCIS